MPHTVVQCVTPTKDCACVSSKRRSEENFSEANIHRQLSRTLMCGGHMKTEKKLPSAFFTEDSFTCGSRKSTGVNNEINNGWITFSCFSFRVLILCLLAHCHTVMTYWDIVNIISNTCGFSAMTSQNVCCERGLYITYCLQCILLKIRSTSQVEFSQPQMWIWFISVMLFQVIVLYVGNTLHHPKSKHRTVTCYHSQVGW